MTEQHQQVVFIQHCTLVELFCSTLIMVHSERRIHRIFARDLILPNRVSSCTRPNSSHRLDSQTYRLRCRLRGMLANEALANIMWATATLRKENVPWFAFF